MECPSTEVFQLLVAGQLAADQRARAADHAASCPSCHALIGALITDHGRVQHYGNGGLVIGSVIGGRLRIDDILGVGGMGIVVAATHLELASRVAIKLMRDTMVADAASSERFVREARAAVRLHTEHVCKVLDVARLPTGAPYIVMELLQGSDLARAVSRQGLPTTLAVEYVMQACIALAEAHAAGIVHRDLKPANLFVTRRPDGGPLVKVLDFGIAKALDTDDAALTHTRMTMGSPGYMSPEQLESAKDVDLRTDIWALGVTLYQLLSGRLPFPGTSATQIAVKVAAEPPAPIHIDAGLAAVIARCLEKAPDRRYPNVAALVADLIPYGGPAARRIATSVSVLANASISLTGPVPPGLAYAATTPASGQSAAHAPTAPQHAATHQTAAAYQTAATGSPMLPPQTAPPSAAMAMPAQRRSRAVVIVAVIAAVAGALIAVVVMSARSHEPERVVTGSSNGVSSETAPVVATLQPGSSDGAPTDPSASGRGTVATTGAVDAAIDARIDAAKDAAVVHAQPTDAGVHVASVHHVPPDAPRAPIDAAIAHSSMFFDAGVLPEALTDAQVVAGLQQVEAKIRQCFEHNRVTDETTGTFEVSPDGKITHVKLDKQHTSSAFESCINWVSRDAKLPKSVHGATFTTQLAPP